MVGCEHCLVPRHRHSAGKQGARGVVGRMQNAKHRLQCTYPTTPRTLPYDKEGRLGTRQLRIRDDYYLT